MSDVITYAPKAWKLLHGIFCIYKPTGIDLRQLKGRIANILVRDLNVLECRKPRSLVKINGLLGTNTELAVSTTESYADNVLVVGPRYQIKDFSLGWITHHGPLTTGLTVLGIGRYASRVRLLEEKHLVRTYEVEGKLGFVTDDLTENGKILEKSSFRHITENKFESILAALQASHQTIAYKYAGVSLNSQKAYEIASKGLVRPSDKSQILIYGIRCLKFVPPDFTIEVHCVNENEDYLKEFVHHIGTRLKCWASTCKIRMIRYGRFTLEHALLRKHWNLENIIDNIEFSTAVFEKQLIEPGHVHLQYYEPD